MRNLPNEILALNQRERHCSNRTTPLTEPIGFTAPTLQITPAHGECPYLFFYHRRFQSQGPQKCFPACGFARIGPRRSLLCCALQRLPLGDDGSLNRKRWKGNFKIQEAAFLKSVTTYSR